MTDDPLAPLPPPLEAQPIFRALLDEAVDFVVIGGVAGIVHGSSYPTYDLDVAYSREADNLERLARTLQRLNVTLANAPPDLPFIADARTLENGANFTFVTPHGRFDILGHVPGVSSYEGLRAAAVRHEIEGEVVPVASIDHLIATKRAAGRTKDMLMLEDYIVIADEQRKSAADDQAE